MKEPDLTRYSRENLDRMLYAYRSLAREHLDCGHWALAKWATRMNTLVTIELARRDQLDAEAQEQQTALPW